MQVFELSEVELTDFPCSLHCYGRYLLVLVFDEVFCHFLRDHFWFLLILSLLALICFGGGRFLGNLALAFSHTHHLLHDELGNDRC